MEVFGKTLWSKLVNKSSGELLKEATQLKKSDDWDGAINALREAYKKAKYEGVDYAANTYLRLPKYLYGAGRLEEAWSEYNLALSEGFNGEIPSNEMVAVNHSQIYGSMAGQLKKEKKFYDAAVYQAASALLWEKGMLAQKRDSEMNIDSINKTISQTLKKSGENEAQEQFMIVVQNSLANPRNKQVSDLIRTLCELKQGSLLV
jgi:tetratricopeptide (TPR) repeat protein